MLNIPFVVFSFGQISPLKKGVGGKDVFLKSFFYYYKRERIHMGNWL